MMHAAVPWAHPDWGVPERHQGFEAWEKTLHDPLSSNERALAAAAWDAAWIAHANFIDDPERLDADRG